LEKEVEVGCARPTGGPVGDSEIKKEKNELEQYKESLPMIKVGQKAPDFTAPAYYKGKFINVKLSDYLGKWIILCFYPGDFTFV